MTSNTQDNTGDRTRGSFGTNAGPQTYPSSGLGISGSEDDQSIGQGNLGSGIESGTGYGSSQQQYDQGTATGQYDSTRPREEGGAEQKQYGLGQEGAGTGVGHHKTHQEDHLHKHGSDEAAERDKSAGRTQLGQDSGIGAATADTSPLDPRLDEQTGTGAGTTGYSPGAQPGYPGDTTEHRADVRSNTGTDNQHRADTAQAGHHHHKHHHQDDSSDTGVKPQVTDIGGVESAGTTGYSTGAQPGYLGDTTGADVPTTGSDTGTDNPYLADTTQAGHYQDDSYDTGVKLKVDQVIGGVKKVAGKLTSNPDLYRRGEERATGHIQKN